MITCALTREQVFDLANDVYAHINANAETFDIDQYMTDLFDMVALQTGSVNRAAMFVQTAFAIINKGRSIPAFKTLLDETKYREDAILDMVNRFTDPVEGLERIFIYIGFRPAGTLPSTAATGPATTTKTTPISAEEEEEEEKETSLVPGEKIVVSDITYEDFELLPNTSEFAQLRALKQRLDEKFADLKSKEPLLYRDINNFLKTTIARTIIEQYNTALSTGAVSPSRKKPDNIKLKTTGQEVTSDQSLLYVSSLYQSLKNKLSGLNKKDAGYADLQEDVNNLGAFLKELQSFRNKDVAIVEQEIEKVLNAIAARMQAIETGPDGKPVATSKAYLINEEEYARVSVIVEGILQRYFRIKPFGIVADINTYLNKLNSDLRVDRNLNVREHLEKFIGPSTRNKITGAKALKILDEYIASKPDFLEVLADPTTPSNVLIEYFDDFGLLLSERLYDASRDVGNEFDAGVRDFVADVDTSVKETELLSKDAAKQLEEILKPFREAVGQIASETEILFDEDTKIAGQMDLLFIDENQEWWIVDVKTGKAAKWKKYGLGTDDYKTYIRNALQQIIYKRILQKITGLDKVNLGILPLQVDYDDTTGKINSVEQPSKVKNQALSPEQPFITINENEKFVVFASDSVDDDTKREMTLSQMVDEIFKERSAFVTEEETEDTEEETEEVGGATDTIADIERGRQEELEATDLYQYDKKFKEFQTYGDTVKEAFNNLFEQVKNNPKNKKLSDLLEYISERLVPEDIRRDSDKNPLVQEYINDNLQNLDKANKSTKSRQSKINNEYDAKYVDAVKKGTMTREQAMKALEEVGRKDSSAYAELAALEDTDAKAEIEREKSIITDSEFKELTRLAKFFLENPKEPTVAGSVVTKYPALFKAITDIERGRQEELERFEGRRANSVVKYNPDGDNTELTEDEIELVEKIINNAKEKGYSVDRTKKLLQTNGFVQSVGNTASAFREFLKARLNGEIDNKVNGEFLDVINAKYDVELAALEGEGATGTKAEIERRRLEDLEKSLALVQIGVKAPGFFTSPYVEKEVGNSDKVIAIKSILKSLEQLNKQNKLDELQKSKFEELKEINAKYDAELAASEGEGATGTKADVPIGKIGSTNYEVKADGVYFEGKKLDNPYDKTHRELIEADIERRRQQEIGGKTQLRFAKVGDVLYSKRGTKYKVQSKKDKYGRSLEFIRNDKEEGVINPKTVSQFENSFAAEDLYYKPYPEIEAINAKYDAELKALEEGAEETPTEIELTDEQVNTLNKIERRPRGEYIIAKANFIRELINAGNTLSGKITYNTRYNSFTLEIPVSGKIVKLAVYIDTDKKEQYKNPGDKEFTISLLSESVIEDFGISMVYEDVLNVVDKETGETIGRVSVTDTDVFRNKQDTTNILREKISNATTAEELYLLKNDIVKFLIDYGYDETTDSLTKALDERLDNLKIRPIGGFDFFHKKDETPSINTAYKIVSYNATKKEITVSLVTDPSVKETISTSQFMNTFDPIVDATETPAKLTTEETLLLDITDENLQRVMVDPSFFTQEVTEDSKDLEDDLANNAKC